MTIFLLTKEYYIDHEEHGTHIISYTTDETIAKATVAKTELFFKIKEYFDKAFKDYEKSHPYLSKYELEILNRGEPKFDSSERYYMHIPLENRLKAIQDAKNDFPNSTNMQEYKRVLNKARKIDAYPPYCYENTKLAASIKFGQELIDEYESIKDKLDSLPNSYDSVEEHKG